MRAALALAVLLAARSAAADATVSVTLNARGEQMARDIGVTVAELNDMAATQIDDLYKLSRIEELLRDLADTAAFAQRGLAVSYAVDPGDLMAGFAAAGVHGDVAIGTTNELAGGSIVNLSLMTGANLARWHQPRWTVFAGGFYESSTIYNLTGHLLTLGAHAQYQLLPASAPGGVRWTGLAATTGIEYTRWTIGDAGAIESHFSAVGPDKTYTVHMSSTGTLDVLASTASVPLELSTGVRFAGVLGLYVAAGASLTTGSSSIETMLDSNLTILSNRTPIGTATITAEGRNDPHAFALHGLAGLEIHTRHARVFLQGAESPSQIAVSLGLRLVR